MKIQIGTPTITDDVEVIETVKATKPMNPNDSFYGLKKGIKYYCGSCRKGFHNQYPDDKVCKKNGCKCYCQWGFIGRNGKTIIKWNEKDTSEVILEEENDYKRKDIDNIIDNANFEWEKLKKLGVIYSYKICIRCEEKSTFYGVYCKSCKNEMEKNMIKFESKKFKGEIE